MRLKLALLAIGLTSIASIAAVTLPNKIPVTGPGLIPGSTINTMIDAIKELQDGTGQASITTGAITGNDSSLGITGQAAAQGGAIALVGGTSSTSGNAGGAITGTGGTPGATGVGGAITFTGGIGGATSGSGGAFLGRGGAGTGVTTTGGSSAIRGGDAGAGASTSAGGIGGNSVVRAGDGGAKADTGAAAGGQGGAATITSGTGGATASAGSDSGGAAGSVTITGGAGGAATAGTGNGGAGGSINLVPGAGGATTGGTAGVAGLVQFNGNAGITCPTFFTIGAPAAATDTVFFIATRPYRVISISQVHAVAAGGTSTLQVTKDSSTNAPGAGSDLLQSAFNLNATANTVQAGTLVATLATITLAAGDRLAVDFADAIQSSSGVAVTACLAPT